MDKPALPPLEGEQSGRGPLAWFASTPVAANLLMIVILVAGAMSLTSIKIEVFPEIDPGLIRISVPYPGASPAEVEEAICLRVEEAIKGIEGIKRLNSVANEGMGTVVAELEDFADDREVLDDIKAAVDQIEAFPPEEAEEPKVVDVDARVQVISVALYGNVPERTLKELAEQVREDLTQNPIISQVDIVGARRYEISIEVSEESLRRYGLTFDQVADAVAESSVDSPAGTLKSPGQDFLIRTKGRSYVGRDFEDIVVLRRQDGTELHIKDVATVKDGFEDTDSATYFDRKPAVLLKVYRVGNQGALDVAREVQQYVRAKALPKGVEITTWSNRASFLRGRLDLLIRNAIIGLALVLLCLTLFLDLRLAFWITMGIPISFMGGFLLMPIFGLSVNMISLFALIVVLGIVVDDAIVVGENIFDYLQQGIPPLTAAIKGVHEMVAPVTFAVLTTIAAFLPLMYTKGQLGKILWQIPAVVISVLLVSLVEAFLILPAHLSSKHRRRKAGPTVWVQARVRAGLQWLIDGPYVRLLTVAVRWRYVTMAAAVAGFLVTLGFIGGGFIQFRFLPDVEADNMWASLQMPLGTPVQRTRQIVRRLEQAAEQVAHEYDARTPADAPSLIRHMATTVGGQPFTSLTQGGPGAVSSIAVGASHLAEVNIELLSSEQRTVASPDVAQRWREIVGDVPGVARLSFTSSFFSAGEAINVQLMHRDMEVLVAASERLKEQLARFGGVSDIADSFEPGKRERQATKLTPQGHAAGLTLQDVSRHLRQGFYGKEVQRIQRGREDIKVMVRYTEAERRSLATIDQMRIPLRDGTRVPLHTVVQLREGRGYAVINRVDQRRVVNVTADVDEATANANEINSALRNEVLDDIAREFPGLTYSFEGEQREQRESLGSMGKNMLIAMLIIFALLAVQFRSYAQPLIVMSVIPFGLVGAVIGHVIMGIDLSMLSGFGVVALTGVVVNDSLIMIDLINRRRRAGVGMMRAVMEAGPRRFRPILLTTLTTFLAVMPIILERSLQAKFLIPMAVSLGFGVLFATVITLVLVPAVYMAFEDIRAIVLGHESPNVQAAHSSPIGDLVAAKK